MIKALIFDFDGLILDTETPDYHAWQQIYRNYDLDLPMDIWLQVVGSGFSSHSFDPYLDLESRLDGTFDRAATAARHHALQDSIIASTSALPGVEAMIAAGKQRGLKLAVASSSHFDWVGSHLKRLGLFHHFDAIRTADDVERIKPAPDLFLAALDALGVRSQEAIVFEDSANGIRAAQQARIFAVAVPNELTRHLDLSFADLRLPSLDALSLDEVLSRIAELRG